MHQRGSYFEHGASSSSSSQQSKQSSDEIGQSSQVKRGKDGHYSGDDHVLCDCIEPCRIAISWTLSNPGKRFDGCKNYGSPKACKYFLWYDPPMSEMAKNLMAKSLKDLRKAEEENHLMKAELARLEEEKKMMKREIGKLKAGMKLLVLVVVCSACLLIAVLVGNDKRRQGVMNLGLQMLP